MGRIKNFVNFIVITVRWNKTNKLLLTYIFCSIILLEIYIGTILNLEIWTDIILILTLLYIYCVIKYNRNRPEIKKELENGKIKNLLNFFCDSA